MSGNHILIKTVIFILALPSFAYAENTFKGCNLDVPAEGEVPIQQFIWDAPDTVGFQDSAISAILDSATSAHESNGSCDDPLPLKEALAQCEVSRLNHTNQDPQGTYRCENTFVSQCTPTHKGFGIIKLGEANEIQLLESKGVVKLLQEEPIRSWQEITKAKCEILKSCKQREPDLQTQTQMVNAAALMGCPMDEFNASSAPVLLMASNQHEQQPQVTTGRSSESNYWLAVAREVEREHQCMKNKKKDRRGECNSGWTTPGYSNVTTVTPTTSFGDLGQGIYLGKMPTTMQPAPGGVTSSP